ncbi:MAG: hypothetical protein QW379_04750, partial [Thermoplasmata archaeon]
MICDIYFLFIGECVEFRNNFLSPNIRALKPYQYTRKLTRRKLRWLIRERGEYPYPKKPGASPKLITDEEREYVMRARAR